MATHPPPPGHVSVQVFVPQSCAELVDLLAKQSECNRSEYLRRVLLHAAFFSWKFPKPQPYEIATLLVAEDGVVYGSESIPTRGPGRPKRAEILRTPEDQVDRTSPARRKDTRAG